MKVKKLIEVDDRIYNEFGVWCRQNKKLMKEEITKALYHHMKNNFPKVMLYKGNEE